MVGGVTQGGEGGSGRSSRKDVDDSRCGECR
jgi:hypothetical protein